MTDPSTLAIRRDLKYRSLAEALGVEGNPPSTKLPPIHMELYQGDILEAIVVRLDNLEKENRRLRGLIRELGKECRENAAEASAAQAKTTADK